MQDPLDKILFFDDLTPSQQEALRAALEKDLVERVLHRQHRAFEKMRNVLTAVVVALVLLG